MRIFAAIFLFALAIPLAHPQQTPTPTDPPPQEATLGRAVSAEDAQALRQDLQRDRLARAGGAGDEAVTVGEPGKQAELQVAMLRDDERVGHRKSLRKEIGASLALARASIDLIDPASGAANLLAFKRFSPSK